MLRKWRKTIWSRIQHERYKFKNFFCLNPIKKVLHIYSYFQKFETNMIFPKCWRLQSIQTPSFRKIYEAHVEQKN
jgi:hypothetical protein